MLKKLAAITSLLIASTIAQAGLIGSAASADNLDFRWGQQEALGLQAYNEKQGITLAGKQIRVDYLLGNNLSIGDTLRGQQTSLQSNYLDSGSYDSHLLHFDPLGTSSGNIAAQVIEFDADIVAIILDGRRLNSSDSVFGGTATRYEDSKSRKWEKNDFLTLTSTRTLLIDKLSVGRYWIDDARIITRSVAVPEPGSWALFGLGLLGLISIRSYSKIKH